MSAAPSFDPASLIPSPASIASSLVGTFTSLFKHDACKAGVFDDCDRYGAARLNRQSQIGARNRGMPVRVLYGPTIATVESNQWPHTGAGPNAVVLGVVPTESLLGLGGNRSTNKLIRPMLRPRDYKAWIRSMANPGGARLIGTITAARARAIGENDPALAQPWARTGTRWRVGDAGSEVAQLLDRIKAAGITTPSITAAQLDAIAKKKPIPPAAPPAAGGLSTPPPISSSRPRPAAPTGVLDVTRNDLRVAIFQTLSRAGVPGAKAAQLASNDQFIRWLISQAARAQGRA